MDANLVDPDNRRPVDYACRCAMLAKIREGARRDPLATTNHLLREMSSGAIKMYLIHRAMEFRREHPELFMRGEYVPLKVTGRARQPGRRIRAHRIMINASSLCVGDSSCNLPEAPPLPVDPNVWAGHLRRTWNDSSTSMKDLITGRAISIARGRIAVDDAFAQLPVAMLYD